eukprot:5872449-Amphidinium_carterae.1
MARFGMDVSLICLFGRWGSSAVLGYIKDAPLSTSAAWSSVACAGVTGTVQASEVDVEKLVSKVAGDQLNKVLPLLTSQVNELAKELKELQFRVASPLPSASSGSQGSVVVNPKSGFVHRVVEGCMSFES